MSVRIFPNTGADQVGFLDAHQRRYLTERRLGPSLKQLAADAAPDPFIVSDHAFRCRGDEARVSGISPDWRDGRFPVYVDGLPPWPISCSFTVRPNQIRAIGDEAADTSWSARATW